MIRKHKYEIGHRVRFSPGANALPAAADPFTIIRLMPPSSAMPLYRIKGDSEKHERVATESQLEVIS